MNAIYEAPFAGFQPQFHNQDRFYQEQQQRQFATSQYWQDQAVRAVGFVPFTSAHLSDQSQFAQNYVQQQQIYQENFYAVPRINSSCPSLYALNNRMQVKPAHQAFQHTQSRLVPAQIAQREQLPIQGLQAPFFAVPSARHDQNFWRNQRIQANAGQEACHFPLQRNPLMREFPMESTFPQPSFSRLPSNDVCQSALENNGFLTGEEPLNGLKLIPASASEIPAHPPIEKSAVPFTDFAIELVWEICQNAKEQAAAMHDGSRFDHSPGTPGRYGSIGGERAARKHKSSDSSSRHAAFNDLLFSGSSGIASYLSSPESPASPQTPPSSTISSACPIPTQFQNGKAEFMHTPRQVAPWTRDRWNTVSNSPDATPSGPSPAFRRFVKDLLTLTLITPQVLLLALYYVAKLPGDSALPLFANHGMPYKVILGALICSNKVFEDNSFRSSTWSTVSQCPIADTVAAETLVLRHLNFDLNVKAPEWTSWLHSLVERRARQQPSFDDPVLSRLCSLLDEC